MNCRARFGNTIGEKLEIIFSILLMDNCIVYYDFVNLICLNGLTSPDSINKSWANIICFE